MAQKKIVEISNMDYSELILLLFNNPKLEIKAGTLFIILREFHKHLESTYGLKEVPKIIVPDKSIKNLKGEKI